MPPNVVEVQEPGGIFHYGINALSKNPIIGNRKSLPNGNGVILGATGMGKSQKTKTEMGEVLVHTMDDVLVIDPHNEYQSLTEYFCGEFVNIGKVGKNPCEIRWIRPLLTIMNPSRHFCMTRSP
ncbi:MAG: helicase HerA domain-containing protein [Ruminococcus sp.]